MPRKAVIALGIASVMPIVAVVAHLVGVPAFALLLDRAAVGGDTVVPAVIGMLVLGGLLTLAIVGWLVSLVSCLTHALAFNDAPFQDRAIWAALLLLGVGLVTPIYVYVVLWRDQGYARRAVAV